LLIIAIFLLGLRYGGRMSYDIEQETLASRKMLEARIPAGEPGGPPSQDLHGGPLLGGSAPEI
jgi:hypothetical protein